MAFDVLRGVARERGAIDPEMRDYAILSAKMAAGLPFNSKGDGVFEFNSQGQIQGFAKTAAAPQPL